MPDHKLEPGQLVLVRDADFEAWDLAHFSFFDEEDCYPFRVIVGGVGFKQCIAFNAETRHLQNTKQPYEPPNPPVEYEWGQKVEVNQGDSKWKIAIYIAPTRDSDEHWCTKKESPYTLSVLKSANIRPLTDDTAAH